jgi:phage shock protein PspC (stress-responsive transcriptional regulator)
MKKIININLSGRVIPIEDTAYDSLQRYIESLRRYFANEEGRDEIINDIESRIAELMNDKVRKGAAAVTEADMDEIISAMGRVEDFEKADAENAASAANPGTGEYFAGSKGPNFSFNVKARGRLYRNENDKFIGGVCSGIANYINLDPAIVRILFAIITFGGFGSGVLIYILLWAILPAGNLEQLPGKRLYRNPDDRIIGGVAGGLAAYFNKSPKIIRLIFAAPFIINVVLGVLSGLFNTFHGPDFGDVFFGAFTGTFFLAYVVLWIVLPEASSSFQKMEMRGETVDVNSIKENVQAGMSDFNARMKSWGEEVKSTAQRMSDSAQTFTQQQARPFATEFSNNVVRPAANGVGHAIGVIFKAFFLFIAGCIALFLFGMLMVFLFGGIAWWPAVNFLFTSGWQKFLFWGTLIFFIAVPVIGFITWLIRRVAKARGNRYLGWTFGGLWTIGWICAVLLASSIARDVRRRDGVEAELPVNVSGSRMVVNVAEPRIRYSGNLWGVHDDDGGWDISDDTLRYNNVNIMVDKSDDSAYHVTVHKYSQGSSATDARTRAEATQFTAYTQDSVLHIGSGLRLDKRNTFRGQGVVVEIKVPVGKRLRFNQSVDETFRPWDIRVTERSGKRRYNGRYRVEWEWAESFDWKPNMDYIMTSEGTLAEPDKVNIVNGNVIEQRRDSEKEIQEEVDELERRIRDRREKLEEMRRDSSNKLERELERLEELRRRRRDTTGNN